MGIRETIELILKVEDQASQAVKQSEETVKKFGDTAKQANEKATKASQLTQKQMNSLSHKIAGVVASSNQVGSKGSSQFKRYNRSIQDSIVKFNMLDAETQEMLQYLSQMSAKGREAFLEMSTKAQDAVAKFDALENATHTWSGSLEYSRSKLQLLGADTQSLTGKIQVVGNSIQTYLGTKWDGLKSKVAEFGDYIKTKLTSALSHVRSALDSLGSAFSGLGGIISSAIGAIGMASIYDLTVGLAMSRESMTSLMEATLGTADAADQMINGIEGGFEGLDNMTNSSLVSLDLLGKAMSTIKMSTGMTNEQLMAFSTTVNDIGQRAIILGKTGEEALLLMQAAGRGLNGEFEMLKTNFGITKEQLVDLGWSGAADDVAGYQAALDKALEKGGSMEDMLNTTSGHLEQLKKNFRVAGRHVGEMFTPYIDKAVQYLNKLNEKCPDLFENLVMIAGAISGFATLAPTISPMLQAFDNLHSKGSKVMTFFRESSVIQSFWSTLKGGQGILAAISAGYNAMAISEYIALGPLLLIIAALALLAVAVYEVGKYFGWWTDVGSMLEAIWAGVQRLWSAFINHPDVQAAIQAISDAFKTLGEWVSQAWNAVCEFFNISQGSEFDIIRSYIDALAYEWKIISIPIKAVIKYLQWLISVYMRLYEVLQPIGAYILELLGPSFEALSNIIGTVISEVSKVIDVLNAFLDGQVGIEEVISTVTSAVWNIWSSFMTNLGAIWWNVLNTIGQLIWDFVTNMPIWAAQAGMSFLQGLWTWIQQVPPMILNFLVQAAMNINTTMLRWVSEGRAKAIAFVMGIINYIRTLPQKAWTWLVATLNNIIQAGQQWISNAKSKASEVVSGVISYISQLPEKVYQEFMNIGDKILQAGSDLVNKAIQVGKNIVDGLLGAMGIHSPGTIQTKVVEEFTNMVGGIADKIKPAFETAESMGRAIVDGFGNPKLETDTTNILPNEDALKTSIGVQAELTHPSDMPTATMNTSGVNTSNTNVIGSFDNLADMTGNALQSMVDKDKLAYQTIQTNDSNTLSNITTNLQQKMGMMTNSVRSNMDNIVSKNKSGMNTVKNTTSTQLNAMVTKTKSANEKMIKSWGIMKNGIIDAADTIRSDSTKHFDKLSKTIGTFYGKLKNPSRWGAGGPNGPRRGKSTRGFSKITNAIKSANLPTYLTLGQIRSNPLIDSGSFGDYVIRDPKSNRFSVSDLIKYGIMSIGKGAGDYSSIPSPNVKFIKDTSKEYDMKGPIVGRFSTNKGFKVKDFLTGVPKFSFDDFRRVAEDVYSQTRYEFYYDNDHHGNWVNAFNAGSMNCLHGAESLIALAKVFGFNGSLVHGHWNEFGHYFANIAGHKMDVTGWQQRRTWTPSASAGPTPKGYGFKDLLDAIKSLFDDDPKTGLSSNSSAEVSGSLTLIHEFKDVPEHISEEELAKMVEDSATNENFIKKLVRNIKFQDWDAKEKLRLERKNNRVKGV